MGINFKLEICLFPSGIAVAYALIALNFFPFGFNLLGPFGNIFRGIWHIIIMTACDGLTLPWGYPRNFFQTRWTHSYLIRLDHCNWMMICYPLAMTLWPQGTWDASQGELNRVIMGGFLECWWQWCARLFLMKVTHREPSYACRVDHPWKCDSGWFNPLQLYMDLAIVQSDQLHTASLLVYSLTWSALYPNDQMNIHTRW